MATINHQANCESRCTNSVNRIWIDQIIMPSIELPFEVSVPEKDSFAYRNFILNIQRLKFEKFGQHAVDIAIDGRQEASIPLEVKQILGQGKEDADS